ncbi:hypothetical protein B0H10DRAFT_15179 [Mycena sp. CBHHK59/15]|nr:hypothetical protein B0H10DRAFT_15179 [Mycena sp. CBHHK59/15]
MLIWFGSRRSILKYVSSFFARVSPRLETLSIQSSSSLDLSCLLHRLPSFTHLHRLLLHIFLDHDVVSDPSGLEDFFAHSALELRHLTLFLYHAAVASVERVLPSLAMARARVPSLETLEINFGMPYPGLASSLHLELHSVFNGARNTLHTLVLEGIALSYVDLETLMSAFADREADDILRTRNLPRVSTLGIIFMNLSLIPDGPAENESECRAYFKKEIRERKYPGWKLYDLSIWHRDRSVDTSRWDLVSSFPECIPTIVRFFGHPLPQTSRSQGAQRLLHSVPTI